MTSTVSSPPTYAAWLKGLRGIAALLVYWHHHQMFAHEQSDSALLECAFGYREHYLPATLPLVRLLFSGGHFAVALFFVASGYGLSVTPMRLIQSNRRDELGELLASAVSRRWLRLFGPVACLTFVLIMARHAVVRTSFGTATSESTNLFDDLIQWWRQFWEFSFPFSRATGTSGYSAAFDPNVHLWTIPVEFTGSLIVFLSQLALSRFFSRARLFWQLILLLYFLYMVDGWYGAMFILGMLLCDLHLRGEVEPDGSESIPLNKQLLYWALFIAGLYLGGVPHTPSLELLSRNPGWSLLSHLTPSAMADHKWFYLFWSAGLVIASIPRLGILKRALQSRVAQELGRVSFGLYLIHGPVLWAAGPGLYSYTGCCQPGRPRGTPPSQTLGLEMSFLLPHIIILPATLILAELVTRLIDGPSVRLSKWIYNQSLRKGGSGMNYAAENKCQVCT